MAGTVLRLGGVKFIELSFMAYSFLLEFAVPGAVVTGAEAGPLGGEERADDEFAGRRASDG